MVHKDDRKLPLCIPLEQQNIIHPVLVPVIPLEQQNIIHPVLVPVISLEEQNIIHPVLIPVIPLEEKKYYAPGADQGHKTCYTLRIKRANLAPFWRVQNKLHERTDAYISSTSFRENWQM